MAKWALVENNEVMEYHDQLPKNWRNYSGLNLSENNIEFLNSLGWYEIEVDQQDFDPFRFRLTGHTFSFNGTKVIAHMELHEITDQERQVSIQQQVDFITQAHQERNKKLQECDWVMSADVIEKYGQEWYEKWKVYRQALRDLPQMYPNGQYEWPEVPS
jgi:Phage tail assembly chaperone protein